jgi:hypothetical protein
MGAYANAVLNRKIHRFRHPIGVTRMKTGRNICRGDVLHDFAVEPEYISGKRLTDIGVEIDLSYRTNRQLSAPTLSQIAGWYSGKYAGKERLACAVKLPTLGA